MTAPNITQERLKELLYYNLKTGEFSWNAPVGKMRWGAPAGTTRGDGYVRIGLNGSKYYAHQLAWLYVTGTWPEEIDHANRNPSDNRYRNLVAGTHRQNMRNRKVQTGSVTGIHGVTFNKTRKKWDVRINDEDKRRYYGDDFFEACCVRKAAENKLNYHENHGQ